MAERWRQDLDAFLDEMREKTEDVAPSPGLVDRVMVAVQTEPELSRLAAETDGLAPPAGFTDRVMAEIAAPSTRSFPSRQVEPQPHAPFAPRSAGEGKLEDSLTRIGLRAMGVLAAVAAACILYSTYAERTLDTRLISTIDSVEGGE